MCVNLYYINRLRRFNIGSICKMQNRSRIEAETRRAFSQMFPPPIPDGSALAPQHDMTEDQTEYTHEIHVEGVYIISVAARLLEMHPQTLRKYERLGLIQPDRTNGMLRLYSQDDIRKILLIRHLMDNLGLNLAGVEFALALVANMGTLRNRLRSATSSENFKKVIDEEFAELLESMNLLIQE